MAAAPHRHGPAVTADARDKWDNCYLGRESADFDSVCDVLSRHAFLLPAQGLALDLACGHGANALWLAQQGLEAEAWDISAVAVGRLRAEAAKRGLRVNASACDATATAWPAARYDVIVVSRYLERSLCGIIMQALKPGGLLFYQTFIRDKLDPSGPGNPNYLLETNELLRLFAPLTVLYFEEYGRVGDLSRANRNEACLAALKPLI